MLQVTEVQEAAVGASLQSTVEKVGRTTSVPQAVIGSGTQHSGPRARTEA